MAALSQTVTSVTWSGGKPMFIGKAGGTITRGMVCLRQSDGEYIAGDADDDLTGYTFPDDCVMAMTDGSDGKYALFAPAGAIVNIGATAVAGTPYVLSSSTAAGGAAGGVSAAADLGSGDTPVLLFTGDGAGTVTFYPQSEGVALA